VQHLTALIASHHPDKSIREIARAAGVPQNRLAYWVKPGSNIARMPSVGDLNSLADIIGCKPSELFIAFALDLGYPIEAAS
jgi:transcriptional regulator with XRE-family HTH domain